MYKLPFQGSRQTFPGFGKRDESIWRNKASLSTKIPYRLNIPDYSCLVESEIAGCKPLPICPVHINPGLSISEDGTNPLKVNFGQLRNVARSFSAIRSV